MAASGAVYFGTQSMGLAKDSSANPAPPSPSTTPSPSEARPQPLWPGHEPGKIYLGWSDGGDFAGTMALAGSVGLRRSYFKWTNPQLEEARISEDHEAQRLPWVSYKPPDHQDSWSAIAAGEYDVDIRERARRYASLTAPVISTFHHEPHNDGRYGKPKEFAAAWVHIHDIFDEMGALEMCANVPILGEYSFTTEYANNGDREVMDFLPPKVLQRMSFLGIDLYQNGLGEGFEGRLGPIVDWLDSVGFKDKQVGIGETGASDAFRPPTAADWWTDSWAWAVENVDRISAVSYWNSSRNDSTSNWLLDESEEKLAAFKTSLRDPLTIRRLKA